MCSPLFDSLNDGQKRDKFHHNFTSLFVRESCCFGFEFNWMFRFFLLLTHQIRLPKQTINMLLQWPFEFVYWSTFFFFFCFFLIGIRAFFRTFPKIYWFDLIYCQLIFSHSLPTLMQLLKKKTLCHKTDTDTNYDQKLKWKMLLARSGEFNSKWHDIYVMI